MSVEALPEHEGRVHVVLNETSTQHKRVLKQEVADLESILGERVKRIYTDPDKSTTQERVAECIKEGDLIVSAGGDGVDHTIVETLLRYPGLDEKARRTPMLSLFGGNANQGPAELTPKRHLKKPPIEEVLNHGKVIDAYAGEVKFEAAENLEYFDDENPFTTIESLFIYFTGIGATGHSANKLHRVRMNRLRIDPTGRNLIDAPAVLRGIAKARRNKFKISETSYETAHPEVIVSKSEEESAYELSYTNGKYIAKIGRLSSRLEVPDIYKVVLTDGRWPAISRDVAAMVIGRLTGDHIPSDLTSRIDYMALSQDPGTTLMGHIDGDHILLPRNGSMEVKLHPIPYRVVTTNASKLQ